MLAADQRALRDIQRWVQARIGIQFADHGLELLAIRLRALCEAHGVPSIDELGRRLAAGADASLEVLIAQAASITHTYFHREPEAMQALARSLVGQASPRLWSAAAATGDEAYTMAMMLDAHGVDARILATDVNADAIGHAERGHYSAEHLRLLPDDWRARYFTPLAEGASVAPAIRERCTFRRLNLLSAAWPFARPFDAILCRNILYYFDDALQRRLIERMFDATRPGGWLVTSASEAPAVAGTRWQSAAPCLYRRPA